MVSRLVIFRAHKQMDDALVCLNCWLHYRGRGASQVFSVSLYKKILKINQPEHDSHTSIGVVAEGDRCENLDKNSDILSSSEYSLDSGLSV